MVQKDGRKGRKTGLNERKNYFSGQNQQYLRMMVLCLMTLILDGLELRFFIRFSFQIALDFMSFY